MPRAGWVKPSSDRRLSDLVSVGVLTRVFPPGVVDAAIAGQRRTEQRNRLLPSRVMVYFSIGMALYSDGSYSDVLAQLTDGLSWATGEAGPAGLPSKSAIFQARARLGAGPLKALFEAVAAPIGEAATPGVWLAGRRMVAIDGTCLEVADSAANATYFGRPPTSRGERAAFPCARVVAIAECGTHAIFAARIGDYGTGENTLARDMLGEIRPGMVLLADRGFFSYDLWRKACATGADLIFRVRTDRVGPKPKRVRDLADGSYLAHLNRATPAAERNREPLLVRVVDYTVDDGRPDTATGEQTTAREQHRLFTTLLDPNEAPAGALVAAYQSRWEIELAFDELKTHQRGPRMILRSKSPDLVKQELWGHLCCHFAIRTLMAGAARHAGHDPDRISFTTALRTARTTVAHGDAFSP